MRRFFVLVNFYKMEFNLKPIIGQIKISSYIMVDISSFFFKYEENEKYILINTIFIVDYNCVREK